MLRPRNGLTALDVGEDALLQGSADHASTPRAAKTRALASAAQDASGGTAV